jgi:DNA-binding PadR family transcriptional regulator
VWTVPRPLVYRAIDHLAEIHLIVPSSTEPGEKGSVRTLYRTTDAGAARVEEWLASPIEHPRDVRTDLIVKFVLLARRGRSPSALARAQLDSFHAAAVGLEEKARRASSDERVVALWRVESMRAITRFLSEVGEASTRE